MLQNKFKCTGCEACQQICPKECISMVQDAEGFFYPEIDESKCIDCHWCENVCIAFAKLQSRTPTSVWAFKNNNEEERLRSSSGGFFSAIAEEVLRKGGVVFGAAFDKSWHVTHQICDKQESLHQFRGSKYVQSRISNTFIKVKSILKEGKAVLFTGTPCQISALLLFLRKPYENLLTIDFICHGTPSPGIWDSYLKEVMKVNAILPHLQYNNHKLGEINFRDKRFSFGWKNYGFDILTEDNKFIWKTIGRENPYMMGFLENVYLRPSCYQCSVKSQRSGADLTMGDFWSIEKVCPSINDNKGVSLILVNTEQGQKWFETLKIKKSFVKEFDYATACRYNSAIIKPVVPHPRRRFFFDHLSNSTNLSSLILNTCRPGRWKKIKWKLKVFLSKFNINI